MGILAGAEITIGEIWIETPKMSFGLNNILFR